MVSKAKIIMNNDCMFLQFLPDKVFNISFTYSMVQSAMAAVEVILEVVRVRSRKNMKKKDINLNHLVVV